MTLAVKLPIPLLRLTACRQLGCQLQRNYSKSVHNKRWHFKQLNPFGKLQLSAGDDSFHVVQPIEPVQYPNQDEAIVTSNHPTGVHCECIDGRVIVKDVGARSEGLTCEYQIPMKFSIKATLHDRAGISLQDMEGGQIQIQAQNGTCCLKSIKSDNLQVQTSGAVVSQSTLHCNGDILTTHNGGISITKALGTSLSLCSDRGDITVESVYVEKCTVTTQSGDVRLGSTHRQVNVNIKKGDLSVGTLDGSLTATVNSGNVKVHITQLDNCDIDVKQGDVEVQLSDSLSAEIDIEAPSISVGAKFNTSKIKKIETASGVKYKGYLGSTSGNEGSDKAGSLKINCDDGKVTIKSLDWFSSLRIKELDLGDEEMGVL